jgi:peptide/nickel transport system ATP-binding protein
MNNESILELKNIVVEFKIKRGVLRAVNDASFEVKQGEIIGIVGESGSGKSTLASVVMNLVSPPGKISSGQVIYKNEDVLKYKTEQLRTYRWQEVAMAFQAAQNSLNPVITIKETFIETVKAHDSSAKEDEILSRTRKLLEYVRLKPENVMDAYPHQLSGGMKQRVIIALSLLLSPKILILDEPTTALDVITQAYIMDLLKQIHDDLSITMIFLTHDISIVGKIADRIVVMYGGEIVEYGTIDDIFYNSVHPYTKGLINAAPSLVDDITKRKAIPGSPPDLVERPEGCPFKPRCNLYSDGFCNKKYGELIEVSGGHYARCNVSEGEGTTWKHH